ncbi:DUF305 domain-containing protein [Nonomuraea sp. KC401]|uniref:DUF305 domain-containing protein n=1 Tax=unclassified Nonomuraea TaxID=2593643 RepID=UPI0010FD9B8D|nr:MULTISPECIES: DUF305 domain-containing protein [unclassified Nonomuraea]NBE93762.1 DUF305 domain-containing protein [Nonomuraea sp. K271]TLF80725.1 DUF305 domain-containing protein [Nonomuraea sp. KC401]
MEKPARKSFLAFGGVLVLAVAAFLLFGRGGTPGDTSPEAGFARDMATHHAQAVDMAFKIRDKRPAAEIDSLAFDIINTQANQRGMFLGWLQQWELTQSTDQPAMAWMRGHGHGEATQEAAPGVMPGMASPQELTKLGQAQGKDAEVLFLQLMIRHHEGGVEMAGGLLELSTRAEVVNMAQKIVSSQSGEIKLMTDLLEKRGARPYPSILTPR